MTAYRALSAVLVLLVVVGCGDGRPARVPVSGQVLIDGEPLTVGFIRLSGDHARPANGRMGPDGRFTLSCYGDEDGVVPGDYVVTVTAVGNIEDGASQRWFVPKQYADPATSGLKTTIDGPTDALVFNLTWEGSGHDGPYVE